MSSPVIALYRAHPGQTDALLRLVESHHATLQKEGLVTDRPPYVLRAQDGTLLEIFEWKDEAAVEAAHHNPTVQALWESFAAVADFTTLDSLAEAKAPFPHFERVSG